MVWIEDNIQLFKLGIQSPLYYTGHGLKDRVIVILYEQGDRQFKDKD
jgi:hypothetical protein